jgi:hypothetical protein
LAWLIRYYTSKQNRTIVGYVPRTDKWVSGRHCRLFVCLFLFISHSINIDIHIYIYINTQMQLHHTPIFFLSHDLSHLPVYDTSGKTRYTYWCWHAGRAQLVYAASQSTSFDRFAIKHSLGTTKIKYLNIWCLLWQVNEAMEEASILCTTPCLEIFFPL